MSDSFVPPVQQTRISWLARIAEWFHLLRIILSLKGERSDLTYDVLNQHHVMGDETLFINLGYWDQATNLDEAALRLADYVARKACFQPEDRILDVGFGFADQDIYWCEQFGLQHLHGVNISAVQVQAARSRVRQAGLADRISLVLGDATNMYYQANEFDKVVGLECAFHFCTRDDFLEESYRVLKPDGRLILADFIGRTNHRKTWKQVVASFLGRRSWQIPAYNLCQQREYQYKLEQIGYRDIEFESIRKNVFAQFVAYQRQRFDTDNFRRRYHPLIRFVAKLQIDWGFLDTLDYVVVTARK